MDRRVSVLFVLALKWRTVGVGDAISPYWEVEGQASKQKERRAQRVGPGTHTVAAASVAG